MKQTVPREGQKSVTMFKGAGGIIVCSQNMSTRFVGKTIPKSDEDTVLIPFTEEEMNTGAMSVLKERIEYGLTKKAEVSVLLPVNRLREIVQALDDGFVRLDFLPGLLTDSVARDVVDDGMYEFTMVNTGVLDALRIVELSEPSATGSKPSAGDAACIMGTMRVEHDWFEEPGRRESENKTRKDSLKQALKLRRQKNRKGA